MTENNFDLEDDETPLPRPMPDHVKKPDHRNPRYYKDVDGKKVFNQKRFDADNNFYKKWRSLKNEGN